MWDLPGSSGLIYITDGLKWVNFTESHCSRGILVCEWGVKCNSSAQNVRKGYFNK